MEQPTRSGHTHQGGDIRAAGRFPSDGDVVWITPEGGDLLLDPLQCRHLVEERLVAGGGERLAGHGPAVQEAEDAQPVIDRDDDDVPAPNELAPVVEPLGASPGNVPTTVDPDQYRPLSCRAGCEDVEVEAVLTRLRDEDRQDGLNGVDPLRPAGTEAGCCTDSRPWVRRLGRLEPERTDRRLGEGDAAEDEQVPLLFARPGGRNSFR